MAERRAPGTGAARTGHAGSDPSIEATLVASRALLGVVARSVATALEQVSLPQFRVLVVLSSCAGPLRAGALAERTGVHPSTFSRTADRLEAGGWVRRTPNPESRREVLVELTDQARRLVDQVTRDRRAEIARILEQAPAEQREAIRAGFEAFAAAAGEPPVEDLATLGV